MSMQRDCNAYGGITSGWDKASREAAADSVSFLEVLQQELLQVQAAKAEEVTEESFASAQQLVQAVHCMVSVTKNGRVDLLWDLLSNLVAVYGAAGATTENWGVRGAKLSDCDVRLRCWLRRACALVVCKNDRMAKHV